MITAKFVELLYRELHGIYYEIEKHELENPAGVVTLADVERAFIKRWDILADLFVALGGGDYDDLD